MPVYVVNDVITTLSEAFYANVKTLKVGTLPKDFYVPLRAQYRADLINLWLYEKFNVATDLNTYLVALIDEDAYVPGLNFVFGLASPSIRVATVYLNRLKFMLYGINREKLFIERVRKEVMHEVGHLLGLNHCINDKCVMHFSNSIYDTDRKSWKFCRECALRLARLGHKLNSKYIIEY